MEAWPPIILIQPLEENARLVESTCPIYQGTGRIYTVFIQLVLYDSLALFSCVAVNYTNASLNNVLAAGRK
jgi:hypothetical protein